MSFSPTTGDRLLSAWLSLTSTLWNKRLVSDLTYNEAHVMGILLRKKSSGTPCTATMLIQYTRLLKSQMNKLLTTLENKGYITRTEPKAGTKLEKNQTVTLYVSLGTGEVLLPFRLGAWPEINVIQLNNGEK